MPTPKPPARRLLSDDDARRVAERPIILSGESVRAVLAGRKTMTRRVVKPQPTEEDGFGGRIECENYAPSIVRRDGTLDAGPEVFGFANEEQGWPCPYGRPGERLWVRETWLKKEFYEYDPSGAFSTTTGECEIIYRADSKPGVEWRSPIHMPRWASRLTLEVTAVRVERLQSITEEDAMAEGMEPATKFNGFNRISSREQFGIAWDQINGKRHWWTSNPWVWVITFKALIAAELAKEQV